MTAIDTADTDTRLRRVREALGDRLVTATDAGYDELRTPWNVAIDQRPLAVVRPESTREVIDVVRAGELDRLRTCAAEDCEDVVVDLSRNRSRRYCGTRCGNRADAAAYRARKAAGEQV